MGTVRNANKVGANCKLSLRSSYAHGWNVGEGMIINMLHKRGSEGCIVERVERGGCKVELALLLTRVSSATTLSIYLPGAILMDRSPTNVVTKLEC